MYFHKKLFGGVVFFSFCSWIAVDLVYSEGYNLENVFLLSSSIGFVITGVASMWHYRNTKELPPITVRERTVEFRGSTIYFPDGYHFKQSSVAKTKMISSKDINEINLTTSPPSLVIDYSEVIFLNEDCKDQLRKFVKENDLTVTNRFDIWEHLNQPFLDTEFTTDEKKATIEKLVENGLTEFEVAKIRQKLKWIMWQNVFGMEWVYLGQFDYLRIAFLTNRRYWWTMEIALRNYKKEHNTTVK